MKRLTQPRPARYAPSSNRQAAGAVWLRPDEGRRTLLRRPVTRSSLDSPMTAGSSPAGKSRNARGSRRVSSIVSPPPVGSRRGTPSTARRRPNFNHPTSARPDGAPPIPSLFAPSSPQVHHAPPGTAQSQPGARTLKDRTRFPEDGISPSSGALNRSEPSADPRIEHPPRLRDRDAGERVSSVEVIHVSPIEQVLHPTAKKDAER